MKYIPWLILGIIAFIVGVVVLMKLNEGGSKNPLRHIILVPGLALITVFGYFTIKTEELNQNITTSTLDTSVNELELTPNHDTSKRLGNDFLMLNTPADIYQQYNEEGRALFDELFLTDTISKEFALTLVGKQVEGQLDTTNDLTAHLDKGRYIIAILNQGDYSKEAVDAMNGLEYFDNVDYLAYFPMDDADTVKNFYEDNELDKRWVPIAGQPDFAVEDLNIIGAPSFVSLEKGVITLGINNYELLDTFHQNAFLDVPLYNLVDK